MNEDRLNLKHIVLGTAGHVDHGKTTLVHRLTGCNTDRLKEEITRGITIELGFAPFMLPNGQRIGIVDVPGHEKFIKNMLAGATGIDLFMLVIAADEGVMPQTREHVDILRLLGVDRGVVALTKTDMVDDEWLDLVREDVNEYLGRGPLRDAPVVEVSSVTGEGIPELQGALAELCRRIPDRPSTGIARLAVDRVFTMAGFGTVVTGTLWGGAIRQGDTLELLPSRKQARVRSLQVHGEKRDEAFAGERVAVNLTGVEKACVERGNWLSAPGALHDSMRMDLRLELLDGAPEMAQRARVHVHHGTAESLARVRLLDCTALSPGQSCFAQLELEAPLCALHGDRVVLRFYSPVFTIGGGTVLDASAARHKNRLLADGLLRLEALHSGDPKRILFASMSAGGRPWQLEGVSSCLRIGKHEAGELADSLMEAGELVGLTDGYYLPTVQAQGLCDKLGGWLREYFDRWPMRYGASKIEVAQALLPKLDQRQQRVVFQYLEGNGLFGHDEKSIWPAGWQPDVGGGRGEIIGSVRGMYDGEPFAPPSWSEAVAALGIPAKEQGEYLQWFLRAGELVRLSDDVVYTRSALDEAEQVLRQNSQGGGYTLAEARDLLGTTRKYAHQIGEYFDSIKLTRWDGERHYWRT